MKSLNVAASYAHWLPRAGLASVFVYHGLLTFMNLEGFAQMLPGDAQPEGE